MHVSLKWSLILTLTNYLISCPHAIPSQCIRAGWKIGREIRLNRNGTVCRLTQRTDSYGRSRAVSDEDTSGSLGRSVKNEIGMQLTLMVGTSLFHYINETRTVSKKKTN